MTDGKRTVFEDLKDLKAACGMYHYLKIYNLKKTVFFLMTTRLPKIAREKQGKTAHL